MMRSIKEDNNFYCSQKFWWLTVHPEKKIISSCCSAEPESIDIKWLEKNPGQLFNTPNLQQERQTMLNGERVESCYEACWRPEDIGLSSRRQLFASTDLTHNNIQATPSTLNIVLGSDCNMTCVYCCKQYSTSWFRDIKTHGAYFDDERFNINLVDMAVEKLGQKQIKNSKVYQTILEECKQFKNLDQVLISGGEPFLYNGLPELVNSLDGVVKIHTGLGVDHRRFSKMLEQISRPVTLIISAETTGDFYEFVRFGNSSERLRLNLQAIKQANFDYKFLSVLSNLTIFDFERFQHQYKDDDINIQFCTDPDYLSINVIDSDSKQKFLQTDFGIHTKPIHDSLVNNSNNLQQEKFKKYVKEFASRRGLSLSIYPESFRHWIENL